MATIYDIARETGVSIAAVSQVINGKGKISAAKRQEIIAVMEKLNYRPSAIATALTGKRTNTIGLLIPDMANPFFAEIARAVEDRGHQLGYSLFICNTGNNDDRIARYIAVLHQKRVDGMIIGTGVGPEGEEELLESIRRAAAPVVFIAREQQTMNVDTIVVNDFEGGMLAGRHLTQLGHKRMAVLAESPRVVSSSERIRGFRQALRESGIELGEAFVRQSGRDLMADGKRYTELLLSLADRPTALFCCNDLLAVGALQAAKQLRLRVPADVSIVGFDNTILATVTDPPLSTISQPIAQMGRLAMDRLHKQTSSRKPDAVRTVLAPELVLRQSTAACRGS